jgi:hypothetical protein
MYIDGRPVLQVTRAGEQPPAAAPMANPSGKRTVKLTPEIRRIDKDAPINAVPLDAIRPFLRDIRVLSPEEYDNLPYIVTNFEDRITATYSDATYARNLDARPGEEYVVARLTNIYDLAGDPPEVRRVRPRDHWKQVPAVRNMNEGVWDNSGPWTKKARNPVGYELWVVSRVRVREAGEISVLDVIRDRTEVNEGDVILPVIDYSHQATYFPRAMDNMPDDMRILATKGSKYGVGHYQIVSMSGGRNQGVEPGHVFAAFRPGQVVKDRTGFRYGSFSSEAEPQLPATFDGLVMVFRTFSDVSYGIVMSGSSLVSEFDELRHPDSR